MSARPHQIDPGYHHFGMKQKRWHKRLRVSQARREGRRYLEDAPRRQTKGYLA